MEEIKTNQDPVAQTIQFDQPNTPMIPRNNNIYKYLFFVAVVLLLGVVVGFYFILNNKINQPSNKQTTELNSSVPNQPTSTNTNETIPTIIPTIVSTESTLVQKDVNNNLYTNNKFGFSLVVPKLAMGTIECKKGPDSYIPAYGLVPIAFFENDDTIYLAANNFYRITDEQSTSEYNPGRCEKLKTTFDLIKKDRVSEGNIASLKIYAANIKNDNELKSYFKLKYGSGCRLGEKTLSEIPDVYNVKVLSDGKDLGESECPINFAIATEYNPIKGKLVIFELGQACNLDKGQSMGSGCNDQEIMKSFKFL